MPSLWPVSSHFRWAILIDTRYRYRRYTDAMRYRMGKVIRPISRGEETGHQTAAYQNQYTPIQMTLISSCHFSRAASMSKYGCGFNMRFVEISTLPFGWLWLWPSVFGWQQIFCMYCLTHENQHTPIQTTMISTCYLSETANVSEFLAGCATAVFKGKNGKNGTKKTRTLRHETDIKSGVMNRTFFGYWSCFVCEDQKGRSFFGFGDRKRTRLFFRNLVRSVWDCETKKPTKKF